MPERGKILERRVSRRQVLKATSVGGAGLAIATVIGCGDDEEQPQALSSLQPTSSSATTGSPSAQQPKMGGTLVHTGPGSTEFFPGGFDPHVWNEVQAGAMSLFYQGLVRLNTKGFAVEPQLASKWEIPSQTEYVFTIAPGIKWHNKPPVNGRDFTAEDVVYSLERARTNDPRYRYRAMLAGVEKIEAIDKTTVRITTAQPNVTTLPNLGSIGLLMLAREIVEQTNGEMTTPETVIGTGAFVLTEKTEVGLMAIKNKDYWKRGLPYLDNIRYTFIKDPQSLWSAFSTGQVHATIVNGPNVEQALNNKKFSTEWFKSPGIHLIWQNTKKAPFNDDRVTMALRLLIDHKEAATSWAEAWYGKGSGVMIGWLPPALEAWDFTPEEYASTLEFKTAKDDAIKKALDLLSSAGFNAGNRLRFTHHQINGGPYEAMGQMLQDQYRRLSQGIVETNIKLVDNATLLGLQQQAAYEFAGPVGRGNNTEIDHPLARYYHSKGSLNFSYYTDSITDEMIDRQRTIFDANERKSVVKQILSRLRDNSPYVGFASANELFATQSNVRVVMPEGDTYRPLYQYDAVWLDS